MLCFREVGQAELAGRRRSGRSLRHLTAPQHSWHLDHRLSWQEGGRWRFINTVLQAHVCAHMHVSIHINVLMCSQTCHVCSQQQSAILTTRICNSFSLYIWIFSMIRTVFQCSRKTISKSLLLTEKLFPLTVRPLVSVIINQRQSSSVSPCVVPGFAFV